MDDLRWILTAIGVVLIAAIYLSGRFEREDWRRDREGFPGDPEPDIKPDRPERREPQIENSELSTSATQVVVNSKPEISKPAQTEVQAEIKKTASKPQEEKVQVREIEKKESTDKPASIPAPERKEAFGINSEEDVKKALGLDKTSVENKTSEAENIEEDWSDVVESTRGPLIEDEIVDVDIPEEIAKLDKKPETDASLKFKPDIEDPVQQELQLEIEPLVLVLTVMAKSNNFFDGKLIKRILDGSGLKIDENGIFQFHMTGKKDAVFSVVSAIEPGVFDVETLADYKTPGLSFFCQLPGPLPNKDMFRIMQMKALNIAEKLGGKLCDDKRNLLTEQATAHYNDRITEFDREMVLASKKQK